MGYNHKSYRMFLAASVSVAVASSAIVPMNVAGAEQNIFKDIKASDYYYDAIKDLTNKGIIKGFEDGTYKPNQSVTRAQAAKILALSLKLDIENVQDPTFKDVKTTDWYYGPIAALANKGIIKGYDDQTFKPNAQLTRAELAKILTLGYGFKESYSPNHTFKDVNEKLWFANFVSPLIEQEITTGRTPTSFAPNDFVTRGQMATFVYRSNKAVYQEVVISNVTATTLNTDKGSFQLTDDVKKLLNPENMDALAGAKVNLRVTKSTVEGIAFLELNAKGTTLDANNYSILGDVQVNADDVTIKNASISGNLIVTSAVKQALKTDNLSVKGQLNFVDAVTAASVDRSAFYKSLSYKVSAEKFQTAAAAPAKIKITLNNASIARLDIAVNDIAIEATGKTSIQEISLSANASIKGDSTSSIGSVLVNSGATNVQVDATVKSLTVDSTQAVNISGNGAVANLVVQGTGGISLNTTGKIGNVVISDTNTKIEIGKNVKVENITLPAGQKIEDVVKNYDEVKGNIDNVGGVKNPEVTTPPPAVGGGVGSGSGNSGSGESTPTPNPTVNKASLISEIAIAEQKDESEYTEVSWSAFERKLSAAKVVRDNVNATQSQVNLALQELTAAMGALVEKDDQSAPTLGAVTNFEAIARNQDVELSWSEVTAADGYEIWYRLTSNTDPSAWQRGWSEDSAGVEGTSHTVSITNGDHYTFKITPYKFNIGSDKEYGEDTTTVTTPNDQTAPTLVTGVSVSNTTETSDVTVTSTATNYEAGATATVELVGTGAPVAATGVTIGADGAITHTFVGVENGTYKARVTVGGVSAESTGNVTVNVQGKSISFDINSSVMFSQNDNVLTLHVTDGMLSNSNQIDFSKLSYKTSSTDEGYTLKGPYSFVEYQNSWTNVLSAGKYTYKYGSSVDIQLTDADATAIKALTGYGNPSDSITVDSDRLVVADGWYTGATGGTGQLSMKYSYSITNSTSNNLNTIYSYLSDGTLYLTNNMNNMGGNGSAEVSIGGNVTKFVIYSGTAPSNITPTSGKMQIFYTSSAPRTISVIDENWIDVDSTNFGQATQTAEETAVSNFKSALQADGFAFVTDVNREAVGVTEVEGRTITVTADKSDITGELEFFSNLSDLGVTHLAVGESDEFFRIVADGATDGDLLNRAGARTAILNEIQGGEPFTLTFRVAYGNGKTVNVSYTVNVTITDEEAIAALTGYLGTAKTHNYGAATNWLDLNQLAVEETTVTADFDKAGVTAGIKGIYDKLVEGNKIDGNGEVTGANGQPKEAVAYAVDSYVMNTFARYVGAFGHADGSPVKKVVFDGVEYTWQEKNGEGSGYFAGSNWKDKDGKTLVSAVVEKQNTSIRNVSFKIVDAEENSIEVTFQAVSVPTKAEMDVILNPVDEEAIAALTGYLGTAKTHNYGAATNWLDLNQLAVEETTVTADFDKAGVTAGIKGIYDKLVEGNKIDGNGEVTGANGQPKEAVAYAVDSYVMNTFARYVGAFGHADGSPVKKVVFDGVEYTWQEKNGEGSGYFAGSNWKDKDGKTLVSVVVEKQNTSIRNVSFKIVDAEENSIEVTFQAVSVPTKAEMDVILNPVDEEAIATTLNMGGNFVIQNGFVKFI